MQWQTQRYLHGWKLHLPIHGQISSDHRICKAHISQEVWHAETGSPPPNLLKFNHHPKLVMLEFDMYDFDMWGKDTREVEQSNRIENLSRLMPLPFSDSHMCQSKGVKEMACR